MSAGLTEYDVKRFQALPLDPDFLRGVTDPKKPKGRYWILTTVKRDNEVMRFGNRYGDLANRNVKRCDPGIELGLGYNLAFVPNIVELRQTRSR